MTLRLLLVLALSATSTGCHLLKPRIEYRIVREKVVCDGAAQPTPVSMRPTPIEVSADKPPRFFITAETLDALALNISRLTAFADQQKARADFYVECIAQHNRAASK